MKMYKAKAYKRKKCREDDYKRIYQGRLS